MTQPLHHLNTHGAAKDSSVSIQQARQILNLNLPVTTKDLNQRYRELLLFWHPHRYAGLTNNPSKYTQMYRKGETMSKTIHEAYVVLAKWIQKEQPHDRSPASEKNVSFNGSRG